MPQGGNTSYCGGATPRPRGNEILLSLRRMRKIRAVSAQNDSLTAEAGCVLAELQAAAADANRLLPMSLGSEGSATLGGIVSTNAGGTAVLRYGMMRALVLGLEVVLPDGRVLNQLSALRKDNTGYDLKQLFIGAEGTLGVVTAATLRLFPRPAAVATALAGLGTPAAALELLGALREELGDTVTTFELMPRIALEFADAMLRARGPVPASRMPGTSSPTTLAAAGEGLRPASKPPLPRRSSAASSRMRSRRHPERNATRCGDCARRFRRPREGRRQPQHDISVEPARLPAFIEGRALCSRAWRPVRAWWPMATWATGTCTTTSASRPAATAACLQARPMRSGAPCTTLSPRMWAGSQFEFLQPLRIGQSKVGELERYENPVALELMRTVKRALDPLGIMNPGKVLRDQS